MKKIKYTLFYSLFIVLVGGICSSCADKLDLAPIDYYGSGSYWKTEAHVIGYMDGIHKHLRCGVSTYISMGRSTRRKLDYGWYQLGRNGYVVWGYQAAKF